MDEAKEDMIDVVKFLQNPEAFNHVGAKIPKGNVEVNVIELPQKESFYHTGKTARIIIRILYIKVTQKDNAKVQIRSTFSACNTL